MSVAFIMDAPDRGAWVDPATILVIGVLFAGWAMLLASMAFVFPRRTTGRERLSPTFWYVAATAVGLIFLAVWLQLFAPPVPGGMD